MAETVEQKYARLKQEYKDFWSKAKLDDSAKTKVAEQVQRILKNRKIYEQTVKGMSIPWWFVAVLHYRESSLNFSTHLHNGDPLTARTKNVPANRPTGNPPFTWAESAQDAIKLKGLDRLTDVSIERLLFEAERYNGFGYRNRNDESVYIWAGTNLSDEKGKFVRDGVYDRNAPEKQLGVAALMLGLQEAGVKLTRTPLTTTEKVIGTTIAVAAPTVPAVLSWSLNWSTVALAVGATAIVITAGFLIWRKFRNV